MPTDPLARVGDRLEDIDSPALIVELDAFERNLDTMARLARDAGVRLRPHAKTHKSVAVARQQLARGAVGQCVQKVGEAEALVAGGVRDVLVSNQIVGDAKLDRLTALAAAGATIGLCFDDAAQVSAASEAARRAGVTIHGYVEIETGMQRCGLAPGEPAARLARQVADSPGLRFAGLQAYQGKAQHFRAPAERKAAIDAALVAIHQTRDALDRAGLSCEQVTGAGTGTFTNEAASGVYTELQCGSYAFMDADYAANAPDGAAWPFAHSLFVLSRVMSVAGQSADGGWCVLDAGLKSFSGDSGLPLVRDLQGQPIAGLVAAGLSDEHTKLARAPDARRTRLGKPLLLIPGHCDPTINLHEQYVCVRNGLVEAMWPIEARGMSR